MNFDDNNPLPSEPPQPFDPVAQSVEPVPGTSPVAYPLGSAPEPPIQRLSAEPSPGSTEDLRTPWDWIDLLIFVALTMGGTFVFSVLLIMGFSAFHISLAQIQRSPIEKSLFAILNQVLVSFAILGYLFAQVRLRVRSPFWRTIGWRRLETGNTPLPLAIFGYLAGGFLFSVLVQVLSNLFQPKAKMPIQTFFQDPRSAILLMLMSILLAPIVEETVFRGYIYPVIARGLGVAASVTITGTLFGLLHAPQLWGGWVQISLLVLVGVVFTYARAITRTVVASYLLHLSYNSFLFVAFLIQTHGFRHLPAGH